MDLQRYLSELDQLLVQGDPERVDSYIKQILEQAQSEGDHAAELSIINEQMGYYRSVGRMEDAVQATLAAAALLKQPGVRSTPAYGITLINIATVHRAAGDSRRALDFYREADAALSECLPSGDPYFAGLYNNMSLAWQEMGQVEPAKECLRKALAILVSCPGQEAEAAIAHTNLALLMLRCGDTPSAERELSAALEGFRALPERDPHYAAALCTLAELRYRQQCYGVSAQLYSEALAELEAVFGTASPAYQTTKKNYLRARQRAEGTL